MPPETQNRIKEINGEIKTLDNKKDKVTTNQILMALFGVMISVIGFLAVMQLSDIRDAIKDIKVFMVNQQIENVKNNGHLERLSEKDFQLQQQITENKQLIKELERYRIR